MRGIKKKHSENKNSAQTSMFVRFNASTRIEYEARYYATRIIEDR